MPPANELESGYLVSTRLMDMNSTILPKEMQTFYIHMYHIHVHAIRTQCHGMDWDERPAMGAAVLALKIDRTALAKRATFRLKWGSLGRPTRIDHNGFVAFSLRPIIAIVRTRSSGFPQSPAPQLNSCESYSEQRLHNLLRSRSSFLKRQPKGILYTSCANPEETFPVPNSCKLAEISPASNF